MIVGTVPTQVDLLVVGGGPGGYTAAMHAARAGRSVTLVDRDDWGGLGGCCLHVGCIPSKALIELAEAHHRSANGLVAGLPAAAGAVDLAAFQDGKTQMLGDLAGGVAGLMRQHGVTVARGSLRFTAAGRAVVTTDDGEQPQHIEFTDAIIATGSRPVRSVGGLEVDHDRILDSSSALGLQALPSSLAVVGAGYIGLELGTAFAKLGVAVTIVEALDTLLPTLDRDVTRLVERSLKSLGITLELGALAEGIDDDALVVRAADGEERRVAAERVLVAVGRTPNTDGLGLEYVEVRTDAAGRIEVDDGLRAAPAITAIGDVVAGPALAHKATAEARVAVATATGRPARRIAHNVPEVMFTDPEVAVTGDSVPAAKARGLDVTSVSYKMGALGRAATLARRDGFFKLIVDRGDGTVVGAQVVGAHASELIAEINLAIEMGATVEDVALTVHAHPTLAEGWLEAAELAGDPDPRIASQTAGVAG